MTGIMLSEAREAPGRVAVQAEALAEPLAHLAARLRASPPPAIVTCARGSSDHVATYAKYVLELMTGRPVASLGPSVVSVYDAQLAMPGMLFLAISQSGMSPDIVKCTEAARRSGAGCEGSGAPGACAIVMPYGQSGGQIATRRA